MLKLAKLRAEMYQKLNEEFKQLRSDLSRAT